MALKFKGQRGRNGCTVEVSRDDGKSYVSLPLYITWVNHSPTGFEWGYYGSGPSQLAYAIMHRYFVYGMGLSDEEAHERASKLYMQFKRDVIGVIRNDKWDLDESEIAHWLKFAEKDQEQTIDK
jgi:hypothetical protein